MLRGTSGNSVINTDQPQRAKFCTCLYDLIAQKRPSSSSPEGINQDALLEYYEKASLLIDPVKTSNKLAPVVSSCLNKALIVLGDSDLELDYRLYGQANRDLEHNCLEFKIAALYLRQVRSKVEQEANGTWTNHLVDHNSNNHMDGMTENELFTAEVPVSEAFDGGLIRTGASENINNILPPQPPPPHTPNMLPSYSPYPASHGNGCAHERGSIPKIYDLTKTKRIEYIYEHELRSSKVWFRIKWSNYSITTREPAHIVLKDKVKVREYLLRLRAKSIRRFENLVNRDKAIMDTFRGLYR